MISQRPAGRGVVVFANPEKVSAQRELPRLRSWLRRHAIPSLPLKDLRRADAVIALGGDGTILSIAPRAAEADVPVLGVNVGWMGFMTTVELKKMYAGLDEWLKGRWQISSRMMLEVRVPRIATPMLALNDAVVRIAKTPRVTTISALIEGETVARFRGDGIIVATPTGSTAYSLAAQGPVVHPELEAMVLTPICAHSFAQRPVVFPAGQTLDLRLDDPRRGNDVQLCLDGQRVFPLRRGETVRVRTSLVRLKLVQNPAVPYFRILREKLSWGGE